MEVPDPHKIGVEGDPEALERGPVTVDSRHRAEHVLGTADHPDAAVTEIYQVLGGGKAAGPGGAHRGDANGGPRAHVPL
jgi:hypothetical protein